MLEFLDWVLGQALNFLIEDQIKQQHLYLFYKAEIQYDGEENVALVRQLFHSSFEPTQCQREHAISKQGLDHLG